MGECLITRRGGETYKVPILDENYPEDITVNVVRGTTSSATFIVTISKPGNPEVYTYQWYVNGKAIEGAISSIYVKDDLTTEETYSIYCEVTNKKGTVTTRIATLEVIEIYTPSLDSTYPIDANGAKGDNITCKVAISEDGNPASYTYQWYKNGATIENAMNDSYSFNLTNIGDTDTFYCNVTNSAGTVTSRTATIKTNYLFKAGMTSGLKTIAWKGHTSQNAAAPSVSYNYDGAYISGPSTAGQNGMAYFDAIDLTNVSKITLKIVVSGQYPTTNFYDCHCVGVWKTIGSGVYGSTAAVLNRLTDSNGEATYTLNVSGLSGLFYVGFGMRAAGSRIPKVVIHEIILS